MIFCASRDAGLERLHDFLPRAGRSYAKNRNFDLGAGAHSAVSTLSPWLRHRLVLEEEVLAQTLRKHNAESADKFIQEVFWRGYFKGYLEHRPAIWQRYLADLEQLPISKDLMRALDGRTGIECFDQWIGELVDTGYLHNHARMWFASIWIFTLGLPWQQGADFFIRHLIDGDPASNTLSWRWVGGLHTVGKTYLARPDNIERYTNGRFGRATNLAVDAPALIESEPVTPQKRHNPKPENLGKAVALMLDDDLNPDLTWMNAKIMGVVGIALNDARSPNGSARLPKVFTEKALENSLKAFSEATIAASEAELMAMLRKQDLAVVATDAPVGPGRCLLDRIEANGIRLVRRQRRYDALVWPHARSGFFKLKTQIPQLIDELGIVDQLNLGL